ncbi:MAG: hypothetical protein RR075_03370, partial [Pygmaiobacter sp.]
KAKQETHGKQGLRRTVPCFRKVEVGTALVLFPAGAGDTVLLCKAKRGLPLLHVLWCTFHKGGDSFFWLILSGNSIITDEALTFTAVYLFVQDVL